MTALLSMALLLSGCVRVVDGSAALPDVRPGADPRLAALPTAPTVKWRMDAAGLFGPELDVKYLMVRAVSDDIAIVAAVPPQHDTAPLMAVDVADGQKRWPSAGEFQANECDFSADGRLACLAYDENDESAPRKLGFVDVSSGRVTSVVDIPGAGWPDLYRAGNGYLVESRHYPADNSSAPTQDSMTWYSSDGSRSWTHTPPPDFGDPELSEAGGVIAVHDGDGGAQVLALDSGDLLYESAAAASSDDEMSEWAVPHAGGFVVGRGELGGGPNDTATFYDRDGKVTGQLTGWTTMRHTTATEGDVVLLHSGESNTLAVAGIQERKVLWKLDNFSYPGGSDAVLLGNEYVAVTSEPISDPQTTLYDLSTGKARGSFRTSIYMTVRGFDGQRVIYEGDQSSEEPGPGAISAFDVGSGQQVWRVKDTRSADDVNFRVVAPYLFQYDARVDPAPAAVMRLASP